MFATAVVGLETSGPTDPGAYVVAGLPLLYRLLVVSHDYKYRSLIQFLHGVNSPS